MKKLISNFKEWLKILSLSKSSNWVLTSEQGWSYEMDYTSKPRRFYKHKKYEYFITNAFVLNPIPIETLVIEFMLDYKNNLLIFNETMYTVSK